MATIFQNGRRDKSQMSIDGWKIWVNHLYQNTLSFRSVDWIMLNRNMILKIQFCRHIWQNGRHCLDRHTYVNITIKSTKFTWRKSIILWMNIGCNYWSKESNIVAMLITVTVLYYMTINTDDLIWKISLLFQSLVWRSIYTNRISAIEKLQMGCWFDHC